MLQPVHGGFAGVFGAELHDQLVADAFDVGAVGQNFRVGGSGGGVRVETLRDDLAEVVHGFDIGPAFCLGGWGEGDGTAGDVGHW